jgi:hypothetical protein
MEDGTPVTTAAQWREARRPELLDLFQQHVYGRAPAATDLKYDVVESSDDALDGTAIRKQVVLRIEKDGRSLSIGLLLYVPKSARGPVPCFLGLNFNGNHTTHPDPAILVTESWMRPNDAAGVLDNKASAKGRGTSEESYPVEMILARGYALANIYYGDIDPDFDDGFKNGLHAVLDGDAPRDESDWGSIAAWAWGLSRGLDYLEADPLVDATRVAVLGHSRLGKTSLWAGATDERFALVISNNSGCGGAALSRRAYGETIARINASFPHWFCLKYRDYNGNEAACPVDQHQLIALAAPRPVYVASAHDDLWADPRGEFLAALHADPVYRLLGKTGLPTETMPPLDTPVRGGSIGYHVRTGGHGLTIYDWGRYLDFADQHLMH